MLRDDPLFGVGIGQYHRRSSDYMPPSLRRYYTAENAHNQYFQVAGELGVLGLVPFLALLALVVLPALGTRDPDAAGLTAGVLAMLAAWVAQHPLLDSHVAAAFWLVLGLLKARVGPWPPGPRARLASRLGVAGAILLGALAPVQGVRRAAAADMAGHLAGTSRPQRDPATGRAFRSTAATATVYLPAGGGRCAIPVRARGIPAETPVSLRLNHREAGGALAARGEWRDLVVRVPDRAPWPLRHHRLDIAWAGAPPRRARLDVGEVTCAGPSGR
jgi:hypothetical protein